MSIYHDLNDVRMDLSGYEDEQISERERRRWSARAARKLRPRRPGRRMLRVGAAVVAIIVIAGMTLPGVPSTLANLPVVGGLLEHYVQAPDSGGQEQDYAAYKTVIGDTAVNAYGKLTLNEVILEADRLLISSTFEPNGDLEFDYRTQMPPQVTINGLRYEGTTASQSVKVTGAQYTIYGAVQLDRMPEQETLDVRISYDTLSGDSARSVEEPWQFDIQLDNSTTLADSRVIELNRTLPLTDGGEITIRKLISSPISTVVYFDLSQASEEVDLQLIGPDGQAVAWSESYRSAEPGDLSYIRLGAVDWQSGEYKLVPVTPGAERHILAEPLIIP